MGAPPASATKGQQPPHHNWSYTRREFTKQEIRLLLAGEYHAFAKLTGCKVSTARRYGHLIRHPQPNDLAVAAPARGA